MTETSETTSGGPQSGGPGGIREIIERTLMLGLGAAALTRERVQTVVDEFVRRGQLTREEGKEMVESVAARSKDEARSALKQIDATLQGAYSEVGLATRRDFEDLDFRLKQVEHRLTLLETQADESSPPGVEG
ncbi:MAG: hypothetical protein M5U22_03105 [Thermoleophilia bacterium]|nr:hypothetical protein [Thermoleophilia bacterium]